MQVQHGADQGIKNYTSSKKRLRSWKLFTALKTGEVGQLPCSEGRMSRMVSQLGSKHAFGSGDEKPKELNKLWWFVFEMRVHTLQVCTIRRYWVGAPTFPYRALTRKEGWCSCVKWRCCVQNPLMTIKSSSRQKINPAKINFNHLMWACQMIISTAVKVVSNMMKRCCLWPICPLQKCTDQLDIKGMVIITDMKGASANHLTLFNISIMKKLITMMEVKLFTKTLLCWSWIHSVPISYSSIKGGQKIHVIFSHDNGFIWHTNTMKGTDPP